MNIDITSVILALITLAGGCGWLIDRKRHRQIIEGLKAETKQKYMDLAKVYVDEYTKNIVKPLEGRVNELTQEVKELKNELESVKKCACYRPDCPKRIGVLDSAKRPNGSKK